MLLHANMKHELYKPTFLIHFVPYSTNSFSDTLEFSPEMSGVAEDEKLGKLFYQIN